MRKELLATVRADVRRLEDLLRKLEEIRKRATYGLGVLETVDAEDGGTELACLLAISTVIRQATRECVEFDAHFRKKYGAKEEGEA